MLSGCVPLGGGVPPTLKPSLILFAYSFTDITDLPYFPVGEELNHEDKAYQASLYLFMNEVPVVDPELPSSCTEIITSQVNTQSATTYTSHNRYTNGYTQDIATNNPEQLCYPNFTQLNHNNNFHGSITGLPPLSEENCILDFDEMLLS